MGNAYVPGCMSREPLYSREDSSEASFTTFEPSEDSGFIIINVIRLKQYGLYLAEADMEF